jgi:hypothetical protein
MAYAWRRSEAAVAGNDPGRSSAGRGLPRRGLALLATCGFLAATGCLFTTRTPEPPSDNGVAWKTPSDPESVLVNVSVTFNAKQVANYQRSLDEGFVFNPYDGEKPAGDPTYFVNWGKQREVNAIGDVFTVAQGGVIFTWGLPHPTRLSPPGFPADLYYPNLKYKMVFTHGGGAKTFQGLVDLYFRESPDGWYIYQWDDKKDPADASGNFTLTKVRVDPSVVN